MKKKRFLQIICCFCLLLCSTFFLAACGKNPVDGYESGSDAPAPDNTPPSTGDDSDVDIDDDGDIKSGEVADFSQYFSGYMVTLNQSGDIEIKDDVTKTNISFKLMVDRQFDVLAQDILFRLNYIYGSDANNTGVNSSRPWYSSINLKDPCTKTEYKFNKSASVNSRNLLWQLDKTEISKILLDEEDPAKLMTVDINNVADYQRSLLIKDTNIFADTNFINLIGASFGQNMKIVSKPAGKVLESEGSKHWLVSDLTTKDAKDALKLMIAQELTENSSDNYDTLIKNINTLGYTSNFTEKLINIINNKIIGSERIEEDNDYYDILNNEYSRIIDNEHICIIDSSIIDNIDENTKFDSTDTTEKKYTTTYSPRLYKGYKVVIPALVKRALRNTFEGDYQPKAMKNWKAKDKDGKEISYWGEDTSNWASTSLYPYFKKSSSDNGNFSTYPIIKDGEVIQEMTTTGPIKLDKIILQPKANTQPVVLQLQIATARDKHTGRTPTGIDDVTCYEHDIVVELEVDIMYKAGTYKKEMNSYVPDGESSSVLTIDSRGYVPTYIDTKDPNFDPSKVQFDTNNPNAKDPYSESFRKPYDTNGEVLPFNYIFSIYNKFDKDPATPKFGEYDGPTSIKDMGTIVGNKYECTDGVNINLDTGNNYLQFTFRIKSIKQYSGDNDSELVDTNFKASDVVFDISLMPYTF